MDQQCYRPVREAQRSAFKHQQTEGAQFSPPRCCRQEIAQTLEDQAYEIRRNKNLESDKTQSGITETKKSRA